MKTASHRRTAPYPTAVAIAIVGALALSLLPAGPAWAQDDMTTELIRVTNVSFGSAQQLVIGACGDAGCEDVRYLSDENMLAVTATPAVHARIRTLLAEFDRPAYTRTFQIVVLSADRSGTMAADVPGNVETALQDISDFLPYTGFSVLGSGWLRTSSRAETTLPGPIEFAASLRFRPSIDPSAPILIEGFEVSRLYPASFTPAGDVALEARWQRVLESTFTMDPGETVVVGTSKLNGDDSAVVVLLTAVQD